MKIELPIGVWNRTSGTMNFPDLHHLQRLRDDLWKTPIRGQAAVMIGAGFSLNADPVPGERRPFAVWWELASEMFQKLYPGDLNDLGYRDKRLQAIAGLGGIALASEYEAAFGRLSLDQLLLQMLPDSRYLPSKLHRLLLELPWADVFTTNYDTLLERTVVDERYYQLIINADDLPGSSQPRIVKLHGSFPSQRPFIITAEDYRTYPVRFAPFVNTVQQALMENTLVLLGFSGDDPNFLFWSGWVRDHLGATAPRIYLCGVLNASGPQRRLLESRGVIPIDLASVVQDAQSMPGKSRHAQALEWLLLSLKNGRPRDPLRWPESGSFYVAQPTHLPSLLPPPAIALESEPLHPERLPSQPNVVDQSEFEKLLGCWIQVREAYPGWLIAPNNVRRHLWRFSHYWIDPILNPSSPLEPTFHLSLAYELNWRLERALVPLFLNWVKAIERLLNEIHPKKAVSANHAKKGSTSIEEMWISLAFAVAREAREDFDATRHQGWMDRILPLAQDRPDWLARWHYENCLHSLCRLEQEKIRRHIEEWRPAPDLPLWEVRRASILCEIGDLAEAERISSDALNRIRSGLRGRQLQIELMSLEGWCMRLLGSITQNALFASRGKGLEQTEEQMERFRDRWNQLATFRCDPWQEMEALDLALGSPSPALRPRTKTTRGFDPWTFGKSHYFGDNLDAVLPGFALLRLYEEAGLPLTAGRVSLGVEGLVNACKWVAPMAPFWAPAMLLRAGKKDALLESFDRIRCATISDSEIESLRKWLIPAIRSAINCLPNALVKQPESFSEHVLEGLVELLSRTCMRLSPEHLDEVFQLALQLHKHPAIRLHLSHHDICRPLFRRLFEASSSEQLWSWLPPLLASPIIESEDAKTHMLRESLWPDPMERIDPDFLENPHPATGDSPMNRRIDELIRIVEQDQGEARARAAVRLGICFDAKILTEKQTQDFGKALWSQTDGETGLPAQTRFYKHAFLFLPSKDRVATIEGVRKYVLNQPSLRSVKETAQPDGKKRREFREFGDRNPMVVVANGATRYQWEKDGNGREYVDWTTVEAMQLLNKVVEWWNADKGALATNDTFMNVKENYKAAFSDIVPFLRKVVIPRLQVSNNEELRSVDKLLADLEQHEIPSLSALPSLLCIRPEQADVAATRIRDSFQKGVERDVEDAADAITVWMRFENWQVGPKMPDDLRDELIARVAERQQPGLAHLIARVARAMKDTPAQFTQQHLYKLCRGLDYLKEETKLPDPKEREDVDISSPRIDVNDRPNYRSVCALLASELFTLHNERGLSTPSALQDWKQICATDPLPEVRHNWRAITA